MCRDNPLSLKAFPALSLGLKPGVAMLVAVRGLDAKGSQGKGLRGAVRSRACLRDPGVNLEEAVTMMTLVTLFSELLGKGGC